MRIIDLDDHVAQELARVSYVPQRRWLRRITLTLGCLAMLVALLAAYFDSRLLSLALAFAVLTLVSAAGLAYFEWAYRRHSTLRNQLRAGLRGQRHLPQVLSPLNDSYYLINNLKLPGRADDVDHMVVGPNGLFALETKNHRGRIFCRDSQWYQSKMSRSGHLQPDSEIRDPVLQLKRNVDYLKTCINHTDRTLSRHAGLWIEGAVVFTHPAVSLDLPGVLQGTLPFPVLRARDLPAHILGHVPRRHYSKSEVRQIVGLLGHLQCPPPYRPVTTARERG